MTDTMMPTPLTGDEGVALRLCTCCTGWEANRDASGCEAHCEPASHPDAHPEDLMGSAGVAPYRVTLDYAPVNGGDEDLELVTDEFSRTPCDGCETRLAGTRVHATGWID